MRGYITHMARRHSDSGHGSHHLHRLDHLLPHGARVKVAHPVMLRAIAAAKKKNDQYDSWTAW